MLGEQLPVSPTCKIALRQKKSVLNLSAEVEDEAHKRRRWENNVLEKLSQILVDVGLASTMVAAKSVIIPAFATRWLLAPKTAQAASEGMKNAQMPEDWTRRISESGRTYFANNKTKVTSWTHPWYLKPDDLWQEIHSTIPPPAYTPPPEPKEPQSPLWGLAHAHLSPHIHLHWFLIRYTHVVCTCTKVRHAQLQGQLPFIAKSFYRGKRDWTTLTPFLGLHLDKSHWCVSSQRTLQLIR